MTTRLLRLKEFSLKWIVPVIDVLVFYMAVFTAIVALPLWTLIEPWSNVNVHRLFSLIFLFWITVQINFDWLFVFIPRLLRISSVVIMVVMNKTIRQRKFRLASIPLIGIMLITWLSRYWSIVRLFRESRFLYFSAVAVAGLYIGLEFKLVKIYRLFEIFFILMVLGTFYAVLMKPVNAIMGELHPGSWRGLFWRKSYLGEMSGFVAVLFLYRWADFRKNRWFVTI